MAIRHHLLGLIALSFSSLIVPAHAQTSLVSTTTLPGATFSDAKINNRGVVIYKAAIGGSDNYYTNQNGVNTFVLRQGNATPIANTTYGSLDSLDYKLDDTGRLTFRANIAPSTNGSAGIFRREAAATTIRVQVQRPFANPANLPNNEKLYNIGNYDSNNNGQTAFAGRITAYDAAGLAEAGNRGLWSQDANGTITKLLTEGDTAPGLAPTARFTTFALPSIDNTGNISFFSMFSGDFNAETGLFTRSASGTVTKIAVEGDISPGVANGNFSFFSRVTRNDSNTIAFFAGATAGSTENRGIWTGAQTLSLVAIRGQSITTSLGTATFGNAYSLGNLNASGIGVFRATGMTGAFTSAVFSFTGANLTPLYSQGDALFGSTITSLGIPSINDAGTIVFSYTLANGVSGIYSSAAVVPEANTVALFGIGVSALGIVIKRNRKKNS